MLKLALLLITPTLTPLPTPALVAAQSTAAPPATNAEHRRTVDLRSQLEKKRWKEGKTTFYSDKYIRLVAEVRRGKVVSVTPINLTGKLLKVNSQQSTPQARRPCIICYNLDQVLTSTCIEVPCWMIPILKPILNASPA